MRSDDLKRKSGMVRVLGGYSERQGILQIHSALQVDEFDDSTRVQLSNELFRLLETVFDTKTSLFFYLHPPLNFQNSFCKAILNDVFCVRNDLDYRHVYNWHDIFEKMREVIISATYNEVLDLIQYTCRWVNDRIENGKEGLFLHMNALFEQEHIGYRFVDGWIVPITDEQELGAVEEACRNSIEGCRKQLQKAVAFLSDREHPDYKNCIKESISAVESICQVIVGNESATLGAALKQLEKNGVSIHPSLNIAFSKLYGYTTDQGGIRHAEGMFESNVTFEEAKFMLVSCSAFINYLIAEYGKRGT